MERQVENKLKEHYNKNINYKSWITLGILELLQDYSGGTFRDSIFLDLGCGTGGTCKLINGAYSNRVTGVDYSENRISVARGMGLPTTFHVATVYDFVKRSKQNKWKYNYILLFEVLEHLEHPNELLDSLADILHDGGKVFGSVPIKHEYVAHIQYYESIKDAEEKLGVKMIFTRNQIMYFIR